MINEMLDFDRTKLTLPIKKVTVKSEDKKGTARTREQKELILSYIEDNCKITTEKASALLQIGITRVKTLFYQLVGDEKIAAQYVGIFPAKAMKNMIESGIAYELAGNNPECADLMKWKRRNLLDLP